MLDRGKLREALANGLPTPEDEPSTRMLDAAKDAGLVHAMGDRYFLHPAPAFTGVNSKQIRKVANQAWRTLEGGWWELAVLDMMYRSGRFQDIRWSVESGSGGPSQAFGENDIVAIDRQRLALVFVSCKASDSFLTKPLEHVFATRERATRYGGTFAHVAFAFFESRKPQVRQTFQNACTTVGARFLPSADDVAEWLALSLTSGGRPGA